jgi:hypothetical protein
MTLVGGAFVDSELVESLMTPRQILALKAARPCSTHYRSQGHRAALHVLN